jgi:hypothetical protein
MRGYARRKKWRPVFIPASKCRLESAANTPAAAPLKPRGSQRLRAYFAAIFQASPSSL